MAVLLVDDRDGIRLLTLHRPERRNALSPELVAALDAALRAADADDSVRCIVVTGAPSADGKPTFCAGGDLQGGMTGDGFFAQHQSRGGFAELLLTFRRLKTPTIAAVSGLALGGGFGIVLACDLAVAADDARLGTPEVKRGLFPMMIAALIDEVLPKKQAMELMLTGGEVSGQRAVDLGIVNRVVAAYVVVDEAMKLAAVIAAQSSAVLALGKRAVHLQRDMPFEQKLMFLRDQLTLNLHLEDAAEGVAAFVEKRAPCLERSLKMTNLDDKILAHAARVADIKLMGGEVAVAKQHAAGKLTCRERVDLLFDKDVDGDTTFREILIHAHHTSDTASMQGRKTPADGVVCGSGLVDGRPVAVIAYDFTVMAGTIGENTERKCARLRQFAMDRRLPIVWLLDSAGARVQEAATAMFAGSGQMFFDQVQMSGVIPQVAAMMGPCAAGTAYIPGLADFVPMTKGTSSMSLAGPPLVKAATGADVTAEELGGSKLHTRESGVGDLEVKDDVAMIAMIKTWLSFFPSSCDEPVPRHPTTDSRKRTIDDVSTLVPDNTRAPMDMLGLIDRLRDQDGPLLELKPKWGQAIITAFIRLDGRPVGVVASNSKHLGGVLTNDPADKAAKFIETCDAFGIPLLFLQDVPGFMVGVKTEKEGIIRHGAKMLFAVARATVPKLTVVVRKGYGAGYYVMCGKGYQPDLIVAWPNAEISVMGPEGAVNIAFRKQIEASENPDETRAALVEGFRDQINPYIPAARTYIDDVIDPRQTRALLIDALDTAVRKRPHSLPRKHAIMPV